MILKQIIFQNEPNAKEKILEKYKVQLEIYKTALEQALGRKVNKTAICLVKERVLFGNIVVVYY